MTKDQMKEIMKEVTQTGNDLGGVIDIMEKQFDKAKRKKDGILVGAMLGIDEENDECCFEEVIESAINKWDQGGREEKQMVAYYLAGIPQNYDYVYSLLSSGIRK